MSLLTRQRIVVHTWSLPTALLIVAGLFVDAHQLIFPQTQTAPKQSSAGARSSAPTNVVAPSLDLLKSRVNAYWNLLAQERKSEAIQYVEPSKRADFKAWAIPKLYQARMTALTLSPKADEVSVTVEVKRTFPPPMPPTPIVWPVTETWVFRNGNWFVMMANATAAPNPFGSGDANSSQLSPPEIARRQEAIRSALHFEAMEFAFGTARRGDPVTFSLAYELKGNDVFGINLKDPPEGFFLSTPADRTLPAGKGQIKAEFMTYAYAGEVNDTVTAMIRNSGIEVPYQFKLHGFVYTPVYTTPITLRFLRGEHVKELLVRNISKSAVIIDHILPTTDFDVTPLPQTIPPGGTCTLKVTAVKDRSEQNLEDTLSLSFEKPVEELSGLVVPVVRNYQDVHPKTQDEMLLELLKQYKLPVKK